MYFIDVVCAAGEAKRISYHSAMKLVEGNIITIPQMAHVFDSNCYVWIVSSWRKRRTTTKYIYSTFRVLKGKRDPTLYTRERHPHKLEIELFSTFIYQKKE